MKLAALQDAAYLDQPVWLVWLGWPDWLGQNVVSPRRRRMAMILTCGDVWPFRLL